MGVEFMKKKEEKGKAHKNNDDNNNANSQPHFNGTVLFRLHQKLHKSRLH